MDTKQQIAGILAAALSVTTEEAAAMLAVPPSPEMGDFALPCFRLAKQWRMAPPAIAQKLVAELPLPAHLRAVAEGGYVNFFIDQATRAKEVVARVLSQGVRYGGGTDSRTLCVDYSSINIAKHCHIGHLTTTALGAALCNIYRHLGWKVIGINHLGDWGTQFGKLIWAYKNWATREDVQTRGVDALVELYVRYEKEETLERLNEARAWFARIEKNDPEAMELFLWFRELTLTEVERIYQMMHVRFDYYTGESFYQDKLPEAMELLQAKGLLQRSEGALIVDLTNEGLPSCIVEKSDGTSIYILRDIAAALYRQREYQFDKCLYVVASHQNLYFQQLFAVLTKMGYPWAACLEHVSYGMVSFEGKALSTRKGHVVYLEEFLNRSVEKALAIIQEKSPGLTNKEAVAKQVGVGAAIFFDLYNSRIKDVDFYWERALSFDGETGPYVQYTHARCASVLNKAASVFDKAESGFDKETNGFDKVENGSVSNSREGASIEGVSASNALPAPDYNALSGELARGVVALLEAFPKTIAEAANKNEPSLLSRLLVDTCQAFNRYYYEQRILDENLPATRARLELVSAVKLVLSLGLSLLNIEAPERM